MTSGEAVVCSKSIKCYSNSLARHPHSVRVHHSYLVTKQYMTAVPHKVRNINVQMDDDEPVIGQQRRNEIFERLLK